MYKLIYGDSKADTVQRIADGLCIPMDESNTDYQEYLKWLDEGNTPESADMPPTEEQQ